MEVLRVMTPWNMAGFVECIGWAVVTQVREQERVKEGGREGGVVGGEEAKVLRSGRVEM
jgi:hypothetical protein